MNISNATADRSAKPVAEKGHEKLAEKRRALGRGLESLLPGPRPVMPIPATPQNLRKDGTPLPSSSALVSDVAPDRSAASAGLGGISVAPPDGTSPTAATNLESLQAVAEPVADGAVFQLDLDQIDLNPYQTRTEF